MNGWSFGFDSNWRRIYFRFYLFVMVADGFCQVVRSNRNWNSWRLQSLNVYYGIRSTEPIENVLKRNEMTCEEDKRIHCFATAQPQPHMRHNSQRIHTEISMFNHSTPNELLHMPILWRYYSFILSLQTGKYTTTHLRHSPRFRGRPTMLSWSLCRSNQTTTEMMQTHNILMMHGRPLFFRNEKHDYRWMQSNTKWIKVSIHERNVIPIHIQRHCVVCRGV